MAVFVEASADPIGTVVGVVTATRRELDPQLVSDTAGEVAPKRMMLRRLAKALVERPGVLEDGRSPAPKVVGEFLLGLRRRGAAVAAPVCASCGKDLVRQLRRGEDWVCYLCGKRRAGCASCGAVRQVAWVDRAGRPHCGSCPMVEEDPTAIVVRVLTTIEPDLGADKVVGALGTVASRTTLRRQLAWAIEDRPELLTGAGAETTVPAVLRFIDQLCAAGATAIVRPACPHCGRLVRLSGSWEGFRVCRGCEARRRRVTCAGCGKLRPAAGRDDDDNVLCGHCYYQAPVNHEVCAGCGRSRPVCVRDASGPRCESCRPLTKLTCSICGEHGVCEISKLTGKPWCRACQKRRARCAGCGQLHLVRSGTRARPLCAACTPSDPSLWKPCPTCGEATKLVEGLCERCRICLRLDELLAGPDGAVRAELATLRRSMLEQRLETTLDWLQKPAVSRLLSDLGSGRVELSHDGLDAAGPVKVVRHLRAVLVSTGALPSRDEQMARLEQWVTHCVASRPDQDEQHLLGRYARWHLIRRLRRRQRQADITYSQAVNIKRHVQGAVLLLDWLRARGLSLATARQDHLDAWVAEAGPARTADVGNFVRWANAQHLASLDLPAIRWHGPSAAIDDDRRWQQARRLLRDDDLEPTDRVAGLLVLLYAQHVATISQLTVAHIEQHSEGVRLRLGHRPIEVPGPLATMLTELVANRRGHAAVGELGTGQWLFPGGQPGRPISASRLNERLAALGIHTGPARTAAIMQLAAELPAAVIARMLGIHIKVAVQWQRLASGDWAAYAANYSRRTSGWASTIADDMNLHCRLDR